MLLSDTLYYRKINQLCFVYTYKCNSDGSISYFFINTYSRYSIYIEDESTFLNSIDVDIQNAKNEFLLLEDTHFLI